MSDEIFFRGDKMEEGEILEMKGMRTIHSHTKKERRELCVLSLIISSPEENTEEGGVSIMVEWGRDHRMKCMVQSKVDMRQGLKTHR